MLITSWKCGAPCRTAGRPLAKLSAKPPENRRKTTGKNCRKTAGKPPGKPCFWVTFASLNKRIGMAGKGLSGVIFRPLGGVAIRRPTFQAQLMYFSNPMGLVERGFTGF